MMLSLKGDGNIDVHKGITTQEHREKMDVYK